MTTTELRLQLAAARSALRTAKDDYEEARAFAEELEIGKGNIIGKNKEDRERQLVTRLAEADLYVKNRRRLRTAEAEVERLEAILEGAKDARRVEEWAIRLRRVEAMERMGIQTDHQPHQDDALDDDEDDWYDGKEQDNHYHLTGTVESDWPF